VGSQGRRVTFRGWRTNRRAAYSAVPAWLRWDSSGHCEPGSEPPDSLTWHVGQEVGA